MPAPYSYIGYVQLPTASCYTGGLVHETREILTHSVIPYTKPYEHFFDIVALLVRFFAFHTLFAERRF